MNIGLSTIQWHEVHTIVHDILARRTGCKKHIDARTKRQ